MIPYFLLLLIPFLFSFVEIRKNESGSRSLRIGSVQNHSMLPTFFTILLFLLMCRAESVGNDTRNYHYYFDLFPTQSLRQIFHSAGESLFRFLNYIVGNITDNFQIYLSIVALIEILPIAYLYNQDRQHSYLKMILFVNMSTFIMMFSGIRQAMAVSIGVLAFICVRENKKLLFLLLAVVAALIHHSGFMVFLLYPLYYVRVKKKQLFFIIPIMGGIFVFNRQIFGLMTRILSETSEKYDSSAAVTGAFGSLLLFILFTVFIYVVADEPKMDAEMFALRNIMLMVVAIQCFAPLHTLAMRMNYYFIIFLPLAVGKCVAIPKKGFANVAQVGEIVMCIFFTLYFCIGIYQSYQTGISTLNTVPYIPFWEA